MESSLSLDDRSAWGSTSDWLEVLRIYFKLCLVSVFNCSEFWKAGRHIGPQNGDFVTVAPTVDHFSEESGKVLSSREYSVTRFPPGTKYCQEWSGFQGHWLAKRPTEMCVHTRVLSNSTGEWGCGREFRACPGLGCPPFPSMIKLFPDSTHPQHGHLRLQKKPRTYG